MQNLNASWHCFLIDFDLFWTPRRASKSIQNRWKSILGAYGDPKAAQDPPKTSPRPSQDRKSIPNRPQIWPKSTQHRPNIDPTSNQHLRRIYMQKLLKINHNRPRMQAYEDTSVQGQSDIRGFGPTCYTAPPNFRAPVNKGAGGKGEALRYFPGRNWIVFLSGLNGSWIVL